MIEEPKKTAIWVVFKKRNDTPQDIVMVVVVAMLSKFMKEQDALKAKVCSKDIRISRKLKKWS